MLAGLIISDKDLSEYVPVFENANSFLQVQVPMEFVEDFGLLKIDLLGLKTLTEIKHIEKRISKNKAFWRISLWKWPRVTRSYGHKSA